MNNKITPIHRSRTAIVYLRQSTMRQVLKNQESTQRQYALKTRAVELGWSQQQILTIDDDLGQSGMSAIHRRGFQRLADAVTAGKAGIILALEASRLARNNADWHKLLTLCRLADVLIADEHAIYDPANHNDQLLLGLKGTIAEAEMMWLRCRLQGGKLNKARRGDLYQNPATGYVWDKPTSRFRFDPDEAVQSAVRLVFERFQIDGSARGVVRYFHANNLLLPSCSAESQSTRWFPPGSSTIVNMLRNPVYTGTYAYGRTQERTALVDGQLRRRRVTRNPVEKWLVCLRDHHPAYISWEQLVANQQKLRDNHHPTVTARGAAREGSALLQGLVLCGQCGCRMHVRYPRPNNGRPAYFCSGLDARRGKPGACWSASARPVDEAVTAVFLSCFTAQQLDLSLSVETEAVRQHQEVLNQWKFRLERLSYQARLAERRYKVVDPDNRIVARTLERDWENRLQELESARQQMSDAARLRGRSLTAADREQIHALSSDLPQLWASPTTLAAQRKTLLRLVIEDISLNRDSPSSPHISVDILWKSGARSRLQVARARPGQHFATPPAADEMVRVGFAQGDRDETMAQQLNDAGLRTGRGHPWDASGVARARRRLQLHRPKGPPSCQRADGLYSTRGVAELFSVCADTVGRWVKLGWLKPTEVGGRGRPSWFQIDAETKMRINRNYRRKLSGNSVSPTSCE